MASGAARFEYFEYRGTDPFSERVGPEEALNPILAGFYPDPSITRVGDDFYLVNSTFAYFPGVPVFRSRDLVNWTQIGHVFDRASQLKLDGLGVSRGIFAPAIEHNDGVFYLVTTLVDGGGNFVVTAKDPAGPWSDPVWLDFEGIDPSLFFDDDGRAWMVNNGAPEGEPLYDGHRAIWLQEFDVASQRMVGPRRVLVNGGVDISQKPVWIEGPHLFKRDGYYYLNCAEGGTAEDHRQTIFRSRSITGPYEPWSGNPTLTQRDLPADRPDPVTSTGHADLVDTPAGDWWAVFLGCRPYSDNHYNTGRETFLLPVSWNDDGWPQILAHGQAVPRVVKQPRLWGMNARVPLTGSFTIREEFTASRIPSEWMMLRTPRERWMSIGGEHGQLWLQPRSDTLAGAGQPAFLARRQQHAVFEATTQVQFDSADEKAGAGLAVFQNERHHITLLIERAGTERQVVLRVVNRGESTEAGRLSLGDAADGPVRLRVVCNGPTYTFSCASEGGDWRQVGASQDARQLSTKTAGGFVGVTVGLYAVTQ